MTEQVLQEEEEIQANPYNQKKAWHKEDTKPFLSSDTLYFEEPEDKNKLFKSNDIENAVNPDNVNVDNLETQKDTPYKRPNYKKRYDDLKKHYDSKLNEFKVREQELLDEATKNRSEYQAPKTADELEDILILKISETAMNFMGGHHNSHSLSKVGYTVMLKMQT